MSGPGSRGSINGDLIKDYSSTKIKINRAQLRKGRMGRGRGGVEVNAVAVCPSTLRPTALIIRWRQTEGTGMKDREDDCEGNGRRERRAGNTWNKERKL